MLQEPVVEPGNGKVSYLMEVVTTTEKDLLMPPKGERLSAEEAATLKPLSHR